MIMPFYYAVSIYVDSTVYVCVQECLHPHFPLSTLVYIPIYLFIYLLYLFIYMYVYTEGGGVVVVKAFTSSGVWLLRLSDLQPAGLIVGSWLYWELWSSLGPAVVITGPCCGSACAENDHPVTVPRCVSCSTAPVYFGPTCLCPVRLPTWPYNQGSRFKSSLPRVHVRVTFSSISRLLLTMIFSKPLRFIYYSYSKPPPSVLHVILCSVHLIIPDNKRKQTRT